MFASLASKIGSRIDHCVELFLDNFLGMKKSWDEEAQW